MLCLRRMKRRGKVVVKRVFEVLFEHCGVPKVIRGDVGGPFACPAAGHGLTGLSAWWLTVGIGADRIERGHREQKGGHERMHGDIAEEIAKKRAATWDDEIARLEEWRVEYDLQRLHEALGMNTPGAIYHCSARRLPEVVPYACPVTFERLCVREYGCIRVDGKDGYLSQARTGLEVGLERLGTTGRRVWFCDLNVRESDPKPETQLLLALPMIPETAEKCNLCSDNTVGLRRFVWVI